MEWGNGEHTAITRSIFRDQELRNGRILKSHKRKKCKALNSLEYLLPNLGTRVQLQAVRFELLVHNFKIPVKFIMRARLLASWFHLGICSSRSKLREIFLHSFIFMLIYIY